MYVYTPCTMNDNGQYSGGVASVREILTGQSLKLHYERMNYIQWEAFDTNICCDEAYRELFLHPPHHIKYKELDFSTGNGTAIEAFDASIWNYDTLEWERIKSWMECAKKFHQNPQPHGVYGLKQKWQQYKLYKHRQNQH